jgi:hypothetical protein
MPNQPNNEILRPIALIIPQYTTAERNALIAEVGTIIYDSTQNKLAFCKAAAAAAASWELITSVQES